MREKETAIAVKIQLFTKIKTPAAALLPWPKVHKPAVARRAAARAAAPPPPANPASSRSRSGSQSGSSFDVESRCRGDTSGLGTAADVCRRQISRYDNQPNINGYLLHASPAGSERHARGVGPRVAPAGRRPRGQAATTPSRVRRRTRKAVRRPPETHAATSSNSSKTDDQASGPDENWRGKQRKVERLIKLRALWPVYSFALRTARIASEKTQHHKRV